jgi:N-acetylmuramoyl-L-alanine amidase
MFSKTVLRLTGVALIGVVATSSENFALNSLQTPTVGQSPATSRGGLNIVVLDPAHGGTDPGARGVGGIRESDIVLDLASQVRRGLEAQGFQVMQTRSSNENPSFDDRSALANAQNGAIFLTLHVSSTGLAGTVRTYTMPDVPLPQTGGLIPWDRAQAAYLPLSRKLGDAIQGELVQRFKGSPSNAQRALFRELRPTEIAAMSIELASVSIQDKTDLDRMLPGVAGAIVRGVVAFRPSYVTPAIPGIPPAGKP